MRTILFRGKDQLGVWVYGLLVQHAGYDCEWRWAIESYSDNGKERIKNLVFVDPKTIGQFTGLTDQYGRNIFEDDIIEEEHLYAGVNIGLVSYRSELGSSVGWWRGGFIMASMTKRIKVLGNLHDNPTLLKAEV